MTCLSVTEYFYSAVLSLELYLVQVVVQALDEQAAGLQVAVSGDGDHAQRHRCRHGQHVKVTSLNL